MFAPSQSHQTKLLSTCLSLLSTLNHGIEDLLGPASKGLIFNTGVEEGRFLGKQIPKTISIERAVNAVNEAYEGVWDIEIFKEKGQEEPLFVDSKGYPAVKVVVRECPIRQAVLTNDMKQAGPICYLTNGYLCGMLSEIMDKRVAMEIEHAGPNSCLKRLYFRE